MGNIVNFINSNKEWIFSGIGGTLIFAAYKKFFKKENDPAPKHMTVSDSLTNNTNNKFLINSPSTTTNNYGVSLTEVRKYIELEFNQQIQEYKGQANQIVVERLQSFKDDVIQIIESRVNPEQFISIPVACYLLSISLTTASLIVKP